MTEQISSHFVSQSHTKVLLLFAHPSQARSEVNVELFKSATSVAGVTCVDLYREYPKYNIDIEREQQRLAEHDIIIFQFPLYWYSTPSILKEWQDLVLEYGFAYGPNGDALQGKTLFCAITAGGREDAYQSDGYNHFTIRQLLHPIEQTASLTGMTYCAPFVLFGSRTAVEEDRIRKHIRDWTALLEAAVAGRLDIEQAQALPQLSGHLETVIKGVK
ncbi:potassium transporter KefG [Vibrio sp. UCD-FRSSP16_10]|uniref:NAD(P)H-dependent oxidoreductase n=1 Tax=unclassified Vibrio TaxID=2614977 RepID=UPI000800B9E3|nr:MULTISPECIES: NAD(P)H-dependent oxidoreductase [unclassified Vibrio]OBT09490.1 potassium transporter KefG [Vibrio sp. UCD-FRSSP16_30]OBT19532.1 potassium transporter KefG [Vibrio sp. UCD-FRSSP16_10]